jgi:transcriptional regulator with XRE-family HTH domain
MTFGPYLRSLREDRQLTRAALAGRVGEVDPDALISASSLGNWEHERDGRTPNLDQVFAICDALGVSDEERLKLVQLARERLRDLARERRSKSAAADHAEPAGDLDVV